MDKKSKIFSIVFVVAFALMLTILIILSCPILHNVEYKNSPESSRETTLTFDIDGNIARLTSSENGYSYFYGIVTEKDTVKFFSLNSTSTTPVYSFEIKNGFTFGDYSNKPLNILYIFSIIGTVAFGIAFLFSLHVFDFIKFAWESHKVRAAHIKKSASKLNDKEKDGE